MPASGPRSRGARVHSRSCRGCQPWPRSSAASGLVLATQKLGGITGRGTNVARSYVAEARHRVGPKRARIRPVIERLQEAHPDAKIALRSQNPLQLLVAVML